MYFRTTDYFLCIHFFISLLIIYGPFIFLHSSAITLYRLLLFLLYLLVHLSVYCRLMFLCTHIFAYLFFVFMNLYVLVIIDFSFFIFFVYLCFSPSLF